MLVTTEPENWKDIIYCGLENQQIDFKGPQDWVEIGRVGRAKFARHAIALANTLGGYVVVGVLEDENGNPRKYIGMTDKQAASFDPSTVGQTINQYADPAVSFDIARPVVDGKQYVVFVVYPFKDIPHVCGDACANELQTGVFYIRTPDARSRAARRASEMHALVQRALRNQRQMLGRMLRGILYEDRQADPTLTQSVFPPLLERARKHAREKLGALRFRERPLFELIVAPVTPFPDDSLAQIRAAIAAISGPRLSDLPRPRPRTHVQMSAHNESLSGTQVAPDGTNTSAWEYTQNGLLYCAVPFDGTLPSQIEAPFLQRLCALSIAVTSQLYTQLNHQENLLKLTVRIVNSQNLLLHGLAHAETEDELRCLIPDIEVHRERTAGDLEAGGIIQTASALFFDICDRFNAVFDEAGRAEVRLSFAKVVLGK
ncbi:MAG: ATP-binding protein [Victivallales bacterium]|nr:ATP-binding protein [Victivallales bacterium]